MEPPLNKGKGPIPPRAYDASIKFWDEKGYYVWVLHGVPNRSSIYIHPGNIAEDTTGCLIPGLRLDVSGGSATGISSSRIAYDNLLLGPLYAEPFPGIKTKQDMSLLVQIYI